ncbi:MAG: hypothetical protein AAGC74_13900 [Verrucomicrobiota bacterium]
MQGLFVLVTMVALWAEPAELPFHYEGLEPKKAGFVELSMMDQERNEYATSLVRIALAGVHEGKASEASLERARKLMALALHLSPRNREGLVANYQLKRGLLPEKKEADYSEAVFAKLLMTRAKLLKESEGENDRLLGRCFVELAAELDPRNEDAIYLSETQRLDEGPVDWSQLTD